jgi:hypothetical protein
MPAPAPAVPAAKAGKKERPKRDPNAPKKPSGAYIFYCNAKREEVKRRHPDFSVAQVGKALGELWKQETEASKKAGAGGGQVGCWAGLGWAVRQAYPLMRAPALSFGPCLLSTATCILKCAECDFLP